MAGRRIVRLLAAGLLAGLILLVAVAFVGIVYGRMGEAACNEVGFDEIRSRASPPVLQCIRGGRETGRIVRDASDVAAQRLVVAAVLGVVALSAIAGSSWVILRRPDPPAHVASRPHGPS